MIDCLYAFSGDKVKITLLGIETTEEIGLGENRTRRVECIYLKKVVVMAY